jgi:hypothetical protein
MRFWQSVAFSDPDELLEVARLAEQVGFHGVFLSEHVFVPEKLESKYPYSPDGTPLFTAETPWLDPWVQIGAMAAVTKTLRFVTGVYILPRPCCRTIGSGSGSGRVGCARSSRCWGASSGAAANGSTR